MPSSLEPASAPRDRPTTRTGRRRILVLAAIGVLAAAMGSGQTLPVPPTGARPVSRSLASIRSAFLANDVNRLAGHFPSRQPVLVRMPPLEGGGVLGPGPMRAFLSRLMAGRTTVQFDVPPVDPGGAGDIRLHVKVRWSYRESGSATLQVESLHLSLRYAPEDAEWLIVEMTTASR